MKMIISALLAVSVSTANASSIIKDYSKCAVVDGDLARLECFDKLAKAHKLNGPQRQPNNIGDSGKWRVSVDVNPIDDSKKVTLILNADTGRSRRGKKAYLVVRCISNKTDMYIGWNDYLGNSAYVLTRVGNGKAITKRWELSTDSKGTFKNKPIPFIKQMLTSDKLVAQVTPYNENPITAIFDTRGLDIAIEPLRNTCSW